MKVVQTLNLSLHRPHPSLRQQQLLKLSMKERSIINIIGCVHGIGNSSHEQYIQFGQSVLHPKPQKCILQLRKKSQKMAQNYAFFKYF
jgi:hypothetical protein